MTKTTNRIALALFVPIACCLVAGVTGASQAGAAAAFVVVDPRHGRSASTSSTTTALKFKFLKDLGLEKPSWLPDFGGGDKDEGEAKKAKSEGDKGEETVTADGETVEAAAGAATTDE